MEKERAKTLWDFQTDQMVMANPTDTAVVDEAQGEAAVVDVAIPSDGNIRTKEPEKLEDDPGRKEDLETLKTAVGPEVIGALGPLRRKEKPEWLSGCRRCSGAGLELPQGQVGDSKVGRKRVLWSDGSRIKLVGHQATKQHLLEGW